MENLFSPLTVKILAGIYALIMILLTYFIRGYGRDKVSFLVAGRKVGLFESSTSIAATWIWAPALFVGAHQAYVNGWVGVFWFTAPNILCLVFFAWFADIMRKKIPNGYTYSQFVRDKFSPRCHSIYLFQFIALAVCSYAVQILAGASVIKALTNMPMLEASILLSLISLSYTLFAGLKVSVVSDILKMFLIVFIGFPLIFMSTIKAGGLDTILLGLYGISHDVYFLADTGLKVFLTFGLPTAIGLFAGPFGDQSMWQRAFSTENENVKSSFILASIIFGIVPISMSILGFIAAGNNLHIDNVQNTNIYSIFTYIGPTGVFLFLIILIAGLVGTLDSRLASVASLVGHDVVQRWVSEKSNNDTVALLYGRLGMIFLAITSIVIANIEGIGIIHLFLLYGQIRAATMLPTIMMLLDIKLDEGGIFWGIVSSFLVGLPIFTWGNFKVDWRLIVIGSLFTVLSSGIISIVYTRFKYMMRGYDE